MSRDEQIKFMAELSEALKVHAIAVVESGAVPADWTGIELRCLLAELAEREVDHLLPRIRRRVRDFMARI